MRPKGEGARSEVDEADPSEGELASEKGGVTPPVEEKVDSDEDSGSTPDSRPDGDTLRVWSAQGGPQRVGSDGVSDSPVPGRSGVFIIQNIRALVGGVCVVDMHVGVPYRVM